MVVLVAGVVVFALVVVGVGILGKRVAVPDGHALLVSRMRTWHVVRQPTWLMPVFHAAELVDMRERTLIVPRGRFPAVRCADDVEVDLRLEMTIKVGDYDEDVIKAAQCLGAEAVNSDDVLLHYFAPLLYSAACSVAAQLTAADCMAKLDDVSELVEKVLGGDLNGLTVTALRVTEDRPDQANVSMGVFR